MPYSTNLSTPRTKVSAAILRKYFKISRYSLRFSLCLALKKITSHSDYIFLMPHRSKFFLNLQKNLLNMS